MKDYSVQFELLLKGQLTPEQKEEIELKISSDSEVKKAHLEFLATYELSAVLERRELLEKVKGIHTHTQLKNRFLKPSYFAYALAASIILALFIFNPFNNNSSQKLADQYFKSYPDRITTMGTEKTEISVAMDFYNAGNYQDALNHFIPLEDTINAPFYMAICHLNLDNAEAAKDILDQIVTNSKNSYYEPSLWYLSLAYLQLDEVNSAKEYLKAIVATPNISFHKKDAQKILQELNK